MKEGIYMEQGLDSGNQVGARIGRYEDLGMGDLESEVS